MRRFVLLVLVYIHARVRVCVRAYLQCIVARTRVTSDPRRRRFDSRAAPDLNKPGIVVLGDQRFGFCHSLSLSLSLAWSSLLSTPLTCSRLLLRVTIQRYCSPQSINSILWGSACVSVCVCVSRHKFYLVTHRSIRSDSMEVHDN